jgi:hypothetical protein
MHDTENTATNMVDEIDSSANYVDMRIHIISLLVVLISFAGCTLLDDPPDFPRITPLDAGVEDAQIRTRDFGRRTSDAFQPITRPPSEFRFDLSGGLTSRDASASIDASSANDVAADVDVGADSVVRDSDIIPDGGHLDGAMADSSVAVDARIPDGDVSADTSP